LRNNFNFYYNKKLVGQKESVNDVIKKYNKKLGALKRFKIEKVLNICNTFHSQLKESKRGCWM